MAYRHTALSVPRGLLMLRFVGYLRTSEFIFNVESDVEMIILLEVQSEAVISREREYGSFGVGFFPPARQCLCSFCHDSEALAGESWLG